MSRKVIKVGKLKIVIPDNVTVKEALNLDEFDNIKSSMRPDIYLRIELMNKTISILIEDTGRPEPRDLQKLDIKLEYIDKIKLRESIMKDIIIKILHHRGLGRGKTMIKRIARNLKVELQRCSNSIDLESILRTRGLV